MTLSARKQIGAVYGWEGLQGRRKAMLEELEAEDGGRDGSTDTVSRKDKSSIGAHAIRTCTSSIAEII